MSTMNAELYAALVEAGASEEKARKAAVVAADVATKMDAMSLQLYFLQGIGVLTLGCVGWIIQHLIGQ